MILQHTDIHLNEKKYKLSYLFLCSDFGLLLCHNKLFFSTFAEIKSIFEEKFIKFKFKTFDDIYKS